MELFGFYQFIGVWATLFVLIALWDIVWKAIALWRAAKRGEVVWFVLLLVLNTAGVLPIIYLLLKPAPRGRVIGTDQAAISTEGAQTTKKRSASKKVDASSTKKSASKKKSTKAASKKSPTSKQSKKQSKK